jgi:hypothetical protein
MPTYDAFWSITLGVHTLLGIIALVQVVRRRDVLSASSVAIWTVTIVAAPVVGAVVWFLTRPATRSPRGPVQNESA